MKTYNIMKKIIRLFALLVMLLSLTTCNKNNNIDPTQMFGDLMFWTNVNDNHSAISVTFRSVTRQITRSYETVPDCGAMGCVTFEDVPIGTYSYYATDNLGYWEGEVIVYYNKCNSMKLYSNHKGMDEDEGSSSSSCRIDFGE